MDNQTIFTKTAKGVGEAVGKTKALSRPLRNILKEIDGKASLEELLGKLGNISDEKLHEALTKLTTEDYIREFVPPSSVGAKSASKQDQQNPVEDDTFDLPTKAAFPESLVQLTIGAYLRELEPKPEAESENEVSLDFTSLARPAAKAEEDTEEKARVEDALRKEQAARAEKEAHAKAKAEAEAHAKAQAQAKKDAEARAKKEAEEQAGREAEEQIRRTYEEQAKIAAEEKARHDAAVKAKKEAQEQARRQAEEKARAEAEEKARHAAVMQAKKEAEEKARREAEERAKKEAEEKARREAAEAEARAKKEAAEQARKAAEQARREAEENARRAAEEQAKREAEEKARREAAEAEATAKREAEERARQTAEQARREAEEQSRRAAEEQAKKEAEARARKLAQEQARIEAELQAKKAAEEKARREAEEAEARAKKEAEVQARRAAAAQAQKEAEEKAQREAEEAAARAKKEAEEQARREAQEQAEKQARRDAEERARNDAKAQVLKEAEERTRRQAEEKARAEAEARAKKEAEEKARLEAEARAKREAEERVRRQAEEKARAEAEEKARRAAELEAKKEAEEKARREFEARAKKEAEERVRRLSDEQARRDEEAQARRAAEEKAKQADEEELKKGAKEKAAREAAAKAHTAAEERARKKAEEKARRKAEKQAERALKKAAVYRSAGKPGKPLLQWVKPLVSTLFFLAASSVVLVHFISFEGKIRQFEKTAAEQFHQPVKIGKAYISLLPQPHWRLEGISIGSEGQIKAQEINATADLGNLFSDKMIFKSLTFNSPVLNEEGLGWLLFGKLQAQNRDVSFDRISAMNAKLDSGNISLPAFDVKAHIGNDGNWKTVVLDSAENNLHVELQPENDMVKLALSADTFTVPFGSALKLARFNATGIATRDELALTEFKGSIYNGSLMGDARLKWGAAWSISGELHATQIDVDTAMPAPEIFQGGKLEGGATYSMQAEDAAHLFAAPRLGGNFTIHNGSLAGVDLVKLLRSNNSSGKSVFAELTGNFVYESGKTQLRQVHMNAGLVSAGGDADVDGNDRINGRFITELRSPTTQARASFSLSGTLKEPHFSR